MNKDFFSAKPPIYIQTIDAVYAWQGMVQEKHLLELFHDFYGLFSNNRCVLSPLERIRYAKDFFEISSSMNWQQMSLVCVSSSELLHQLECSSLFKMADFFRMRLFSQGIVVKSFRAKIRVM